MFVNKKLHIKTPKKPETFCAVLPRCQKNGSFSSGKEPTLSCYVYRFACVKKIKRSGRCRDSVYSN